MNTIFTVIGLSRQEIADKLNKFLSYKETDHLPIIDADQLPDEICISYAEEYGEMWKGIVMNGWHRNILDEGMSRLNCRIIRELGHKL